MIGDLFGDEQYFADSEAFWPLQSAEVAKLAVAYSAKGWQGVIVHDIGHRFDQWNYEKASKAEGGEVHITIGSDGEVSIHEGVLDRDVLRKRAKANGGENEKPAARPEITKAMHRYCDLHRHAVVRADLLSHPAIASRLCVAQIIAGSDLWRVQAEPQRAPSETIAESLATNKAEERFAEERAAIHALLGFEDEDGQSIVPRQDDWGVFRDLHTIFAKLILLSDEDVSRILTFVIAETLPAGSPMVDALGVMIGANVGDSFEADETFFDLLRDKEAVNAMLAEIGGKTVADAHVASTAKVQKKIIRDYQSGERQGGAENWRPRYFAFPMEAYTDRGGIAAIENWNAVKDHHA